MSQSASETTWQTRISAVSRRINAALWVERFAPGLFASASAAALTFYAMRRLRGPAVEWGWLVLAAGLLAAAIVAWVLARRAFFSRKDARVFLEYQLRLDSRLSAATEGVSAWPVRQSAERQIMSWNGRGFAAWCVASLVILLAGWWLPVPATSASVARPVEKPPALAQTEEWIQSLAQMEAVDPEKVEELAAQARELGHRPTEEQYSHSALEAADALRNQTASAMDSLAHEFDAAAAAFGALAENPVMSEEEMKRASGQLSQALQGMQEGSLAASKELLDSLPEIDPASLRELSAEQAQQLKEALAKAGKQMREAGGKGEGEGEIYIAGADDSGMEPTAKIRMKGSGAPERGRGDAPLTFESRESNAGPGNTEVVKNDDYSRAALGDTLAIQTGEHQIDPKKASGPESAGALSANATGGEAVWVDKLTPAEREALKEFFK